MRRAQDAVGDAAAWSDLTSSISFFQGGVEACRATIDATLVPVTDIELVGEPVEVEIDEDFIGLQVTVRFTYAGGQTQDAQLILVPEGGQHLNWLNCGGG